MSFFDRFKKKEEPEDIFTADYQFPTVDTHTIPMSTLLRWYIYDMQCVNPEGLAAKLGLPFISQEGVEKEEEDSQLRMDRVLAYENFAMGMAEISAEVINTIHAEGLEGAIREAFPDASDEEVEHIKASRDEQSVFLEQVGFAACLYMLSVGFDVGLFAPGPAISGGITHE